MGNLKGRLERLEGGRKGLRVPIIIGEPGESTEEALRRHLAQHPEDAKAKVRMIIKCSAQAPQAPCHHQGRNRKIAPRPRGPLPAV